MSQPSPDDASRGTLNGGVLFQGRYRIVRAIKAGGMGAVYEVIDERTNSHRALKVMLPSLLANADQRARFMREATLTGNLDTEHIVRISDAGVEGNSPFLVMELLRGNEIQDLLKSRGKLPPEEACVYLKQVARALEKTLTAGIVHRDIKPENLFLTRREDGSPCVKILDFGVAKVADEAQAIKTRALGTPLYMAPEQVRGAGNIGPRADWYALAQVTYTLLTGEPYFQEEATAGPTLVPLLKQIVAGAAERASVRAARRTQTMLPVGFDDWFIRATAVDANQRFASPLAQVEALEALFVSKPAVSLAQATFAASPVSAGMFAPPVMSPTTQVGPAPIMMQSAQQVVHAPVVPPAATRQSPKGSKLGLIIGVVGIVALAAAVGLFFATRSSDKPEKKRVAEDERPPSPDTMTTVTASAPISTASVSVQVPSAPCPVLRCAPLTIANPKKADAVALFGALKKVAREVDPKASLANLYFTNSVVDGAVDTSQPASITTHWKTDAGALAVSVQAGMIQAFKPPPALQVEVIEEPGGCTLSGVWDSAVKAGLNTSTKVSGYYSRDNLTPTVRWMLRTDHEMMHFDRQTCALVSKFSF